jgi:hypothetical protein
MSGEAAAQVFTMPDVNGPWCLDSRFCESGNLRNVIMAGSPRRVLEVSSPTNEN